MLEFRAGSMPNNKLSRWLGRDKHPFPAPFEDTYAFSFAVTQGRRVVIWVVRWQVIGGFTASVIGSFTPGANRICRHLNACSSALVLEWCAAHVLDFDSRAVPLAATEGELSWVCVITTSSFREPAILGRTGRLVRLDKIISPVNLSDLDRLQLWITQGLYTKTDKLIANSSRIEQRERTKKNRRPCKFCLKFPIGILPGEANT